MNMKWYDRLTLTHYILLSTAVIAAAAGAELAMGRVPICTCGYIKLWHGVVWSSENSQHLTDWYTPSHIIHGFGFYALFRFLGRRLTKDGRGWPVGLLLLLAVLAEASWEVFENSSFIINRYREATISLDYFGDSVINSVADIFACIVGFVMARKFPAWLIISLIVIMEGVVGYTIHDNLTLNIIMLVYPIKAIKVWQTGG